MNGRLLEVGEIHRHLGQAAHQETRAFYEAHAAIRKTHRLSNFFGDVDVGRVEKHVISDEEFARADDRGARCGMHTGLAEIRAACGVGGDLGADAFELAAANIFQALSFGDSGGGFVEIHGNLVALPDLLTNVAGHSHAVFNGDAVDGDEGNYVGRAHARMRARMDIEVDDFSGFAHAADGGFLNGFALAHESNHAAIVVGVHFAIEEVDAGHLHRVNDGVDF